MKKRLFLLLMALGLLMGMARAESVSLNQAKSAARSFMSAHAKSVGTMKLAHKAKRLNALSADDKAAYYVFNAERSDDGFVIIAGDDRVPAVLGYCDKGSFDAARVPEALQQMLDSYAAQIEALDDVQSSMLNVTSRSAIAPMLTAQWSQLSPFNVKLPLTSSTHAPTGATTVAMAEVMKYYRWPARTTKTIPSYITSSLSLPLPSLPVIDLDWDVIKDSYLKGDSTSMSAQAVATLMQYCAYAQKLDFKAGSTSSVIAMIPNALSLYFDYQPSAHTIFRVNYSTSEWEDIIYNELAQQRPVIYSGAKETSSSIFVCDGYDGQGLFHLNWCANGQYDGYYRLNVANIDHMGTGSTSWPSGMVNNQSAIVGLIPGNDEPSNTELTSSQVTLHSYTSTRPAFRDFFEATVSGRFYNFTSQIMTIDIGWGLFDGDQMLVNTNGAYVKDMKPGQAVNHSEVKLRFGYMIGDGNYTIKQMYSVRNAHDWHPCVGADRNYFDAVIRGDSIFITPHGNACAPDVTVNSITHEGTMHRNRPIDITLNVTNHGESVHNMLYMSANGTRIGMGMVSVAQGGSTDVNFRYMPTSVGNHVLSFSFNEDGTSPIATDTLHIEAMPTAKLTATAVALSVTDADNRIITDNKFPLLLTVTNAGTNPYNEDISVALCKRYDDSNPTQLYAVNRHFELGVGETDTLLFNLDGVAEGCQYMVRSYYYSNGNQSSLKNTPFYTIIFPTDLTNSFNVTTNIQPADGGDFSFENGVIDNHAAAGQAVVFRAVPHEGYEMGALYVITDDGDTIPTRIMNDTYRFTMPESPVTIHVKFVVFHPINVNTNSLGGVASVDLSQAIEGDEVHVTASPNVGWNVQNVVVTCGNETVPVVEGNTGYSFIMPDGEVTVTVNYTRTTGDRFAMVTNMNDITSDGIYVLANRQYNRAIKFHENGERTFVGTAAGEWGDVDKTILTIDDKVFMFTMDNLRTVTIDNNGTSQDMYYVELNSGNGYLSNPSSTILTLDNQPPRRCAYVTLNDSSSNCELRFTDKVALLTPDLATAGYNSVADRFYVLASTEPIWLYKLVEAHDVSITQSEGGTVTVTNGLQNDGTAQAGTVVSFTIDNEEGYVLGSLAVTTATGESIEFTVDEQTGVYSFVMPSSEVTITAAFVVVEPHLVNVAQSEGGTITVTSGLQNDGNAQPGTVISFTIEPVEGYVLDSLTVTTATGESIEFTVDEQTGVYSFVMPDNEVTIAAAFVVVETHLVHVTQSEGGTVTVTSGLKDNGEAEPGTVISFTIEPVEGYLLDSLAVITVTGDSIEFTVDEQTGVYSFVMPDNEVTIAATFVMPPSHGYQRGDVNHDEALNVTDLTLLINYLLTDECTDFCTICADVNEDTIISISDVTDLISVLLSNQ